MEYAVRFNITNQAQVAVGENYKTYLTVQGKRDGEQEIRVRNNQMYQFLEQLHLFFFEYEDLHGYTVHTWYDSFEKDRYLHLRAPNYGRVLKSYRLSISLANDSLDHPL
jgi:hypothetical protein